MRFGRRGLPELVHEFPIDPPAVPFISDKALLHPPACSRRLLSHSLPLPSDCREKPGAQCPLAPMWVPLSRRSPQSAPHLTPRTDSWAPSRREEGMGAYGRRRMRAVRQDRRGLHREPQHPRGSRDCSRPSAPTGPPAATCPLPLFLSPSFSLSLSLIPERARRGGGHPAGALCKSWCWVGGEGEREEGEINLFGWSRVRVSRFPYPGIAGGAAIGSEDHVGP